MILTVDVGNSNICIGLYDEKTPVFTSRINADPQKTETEYALILHNLFHMKGVSSKDIEGAIISSVVPPLTRILRDAVKILADVRITVVGPGVKTGVNLRIDDPSSCGADVVCGVVGTAEKYPLPAIVVDFGTATKMLVVDKNKNFVGGMIAPGVEVSLEALSESAALLPNIGIRKNIKAIGTNTVDCMMSGSIIGTAAMVDGMIERFKESMGDFTVVASGALAKAILPHCKANIIYDENLLFDGMMAIYNKNK